jgi:C4-dicarboxylate-specific signal transduction histidine kinase
MPGERPPREEPIAEGPSSLVATLWVLAGLGGFLAYFLTADASKLEKPPALIGIYLVCAVALDLFVGASRRVTLQRISPVVVLALLVTPGVPATVALVSDLMATLVLVASSRLSNAVVAQAGRSLMPGIITAIFLGSRGTLDLNAYFFAAEVFLLISLFTRTSEAPFRNDVFLVVSFPAVALMLRSLAELSLAYVLLTVPLLFLLTTVDTEMLLRYFQLQKQLDTTKTQVIATHRARQESERESRRKGVLLERREKQLELLNGLGRQLDDAKASEDLARFLVQECHRLIGADVSLVIFADVAAGRVTRVICDLPATTLGLKAGDPVPALIRSGITGRAPWNAPVWQNKKSFLTVSLGNEGWLYLAHSDAEAFPEFLEGFFSAVGRHAGSAALAIRRLTEVRELARREAQEKELVALEKEKVAEQNQNLRSLITSFDHLTEASLSSDSELLRQGTETIGQLTGADQVVFRAPELERGPNQRGALVFDDREWPSFLYLRGMGPSGNVLCLSSRPGCFSQGHLEWCTLLRDFLDKTLENGLLHRRITSSLAKLKDTQQEVVRSSQWAAAGRLAANAAHELNTPLGAIRLAAEQVRFFQGEATPEPAKQGLASIIRSVDRCREVTDRLLITSRPVDHGELPTKPADQPLLPVLRDAVASVQPYLRASQIKLASHRLSGEHTVFVIVQDLYWAVVNVLKNAVDAVNEGSAEQKRMAISVEVAGDMALITISDNGPGISAEIRAKLFEPFFTTKKIGSGNGLGLALSRQNLSKWGGNVSLGPDPVGGGASFVISIPLSGSPAARRAELGASGMTPG